MISITWRLAPIAMIIGLTTGVATTVCHAEPSLDKGKDSSAADTARGAKDGGGKLGVKQKLDAGSPTVGGGNVEGAKRVVPRGSSPNNSGGSAHGGRR